MTTKQRGRPLKNKEIPIDQFEGLMKDPLNSNAANEICIASVKQFKAALGALKTLEADNIGIIFGEDRFIIQGTIKNLQIDGSPEMQRRDIYIQINKDFYRYYYGGRTVRMTIESIGELSTLIEEADENTRFLWIYTTESEGALSYKIVDEKNDISLLSSIHIRDLVYDIELPNIPTGDGCIAQIVGYEPGCLKKILGKKRKGNIAKYNIKICNSVMEISYSKSEAGETFITLNENKDGNRVISYNDKLYEVVIYKTDLLGFLQNPGKGNLKISFFKNRVIFHHKDVEIETTYVVPV